MAYFPNGSSGAILDEQCAACLPEDPCPIAYVQIEYNYEQCNAGQEKLRELLRHLVTDDGQCQMKKYVQPRSPGERLPNLRHPALKRRLVFGDLEQTSALGDGAA